MTADLDPIAVVQLRELEDIAARLASIDETIRRHDRVVAGRGPVPSYNGAAAVVSTLSEPRPGSSDPTPAVLSQTWRPLTFHPDGRVDLGADRQGPAASHELFPPVTLRCTDAMLAGLFDLLFPAWDGPTQGRR